MSDGWIRRGWRWSPRALRVTLLAAGPAVLIVAGIIYTSISGRTVSTDNAYLKANRVQISADIAGRVVAVAVGENAVVAQGDVLFRLDDEPFLIAVAGAEAELNQVIADLEARKARYASSQAALARAESDLDFAEREFERRESLAANKVASAAQLDVARQEHERARQEVAEIREEHHALLAELGGDAAAPVTAHARYAMAKAALDRARLDLTHTVVRAPADGVVAQVAQFRPGDYVRPGVPVFALVESAALWVEANLKETQLAEIRIGQPARVRVVAFPGYVWQARVESFSAGTGSEFSLLPPQNATGNWVKVTQRVPVRLVLERQADEPPLRLGMSAKVEIDVRAPAEDTDINEPSRASMAHKNPDAATSPQPVTPIAR